MRDSPLEVELHHCLSRDCCLWSLQVGDCHIHVCFCHVVCMCVEVSRHGLSCCGLLLITREHAYLSHRLPLCSQSTYICHKSSSSACRTALNQPTCDAPAAAAPPHACRVAACRNRPGHLQQEVCSKDSSSPCQHHRGTCHTNRIQQHHSAQHASTTAT